MKMFKCIFNFNITLILEGNGSSSRGMIARLIVAVVCIALRMDNTIIIAVVVGIVVVDVVVIVDGFSLIIFKDKTGRNGINRRIKPFFAFIHDGKSFLVLLFVLFSMKIIDYLLERMFAWVDALEREIIYK